MRPFVLFPVWSVPFHMVLLRSGPGRVGRHRTLSGLASPHNTRPCQVYRWVGNALRLTKALNLQNISTSVVDLIVPLLAVFLTPRYLDPNMTSQRPSFDSLPLDKNGPHGNAWGLWGPDDQLGTLNLLTDEVVRKAAEENIKTGSRVSLK